MASLTLSLIIMLMFLSGIVQGRLIRLNTSNHLVSDGVNLDQPSPSYLLDGLSSSTSSSRACSHDYGFLPCADNIGGHIFELVLYQYLLFVGGHFITNGSKKLFTMLKTGIFGATLFRCLLALPRIVFVIMSGIFANKEQAQLQVSLGVSIYAGSTVLCLTLLWGICVIAARRDLPGRSHMDSPSSSDCLLVKEKLSDLKGKGVTIDKETCHTAGIMLLSLIPYAILQLLDIFKTLSGSRMVMLIALIVSTTLLLAYFWYQLSNPWIQKRSLKYTKYEKLAAEFMVYAFEQTKGKLVDENGLPSVPAIEELFNKEDKDGDKSLTIKELENILKNMDPGNHEKEALSQFLKTFDKNNDERVHKDEFVKGAVTWIHKAVDSLKHGDPSRGNSLSKVVEKLTQRKKDELDQIKVLSEKIINRVRSQTLQGLLKDDGNVNTEHIKKIFDEFDKDHNNSISKAELHELIGSDKQGDGEAVEKWMKQFDKDGDSEISEHEFVNAMKNWVKGPTTEVKPSEETEKITTSSSQDKGIWDETDSKLFDKLNHDGTIKGKLLVAWALSKPISQIILGVAMLTFLAKPFIGAVIQLSAAMNLSTFFIAFIIVPLITNSRTAISAIFPASKKNSETASLTFSEIYGDVIMNNVMGLTTLLAIVYAKDLEWTYSAEVLIILLLCGALGIIAFSCTTYPLWSSLVAFFLYFFSLAFIYVLQCVWGWD